MTDTKQPLTLHYVNGFNEGDGTYTSTREGNRYNKHAINSERKRRIGQVVQCAEYSRTTAQILQLLIKKGSDVAKWDVGEQAAHAQWDVTTSKLKAIEEGAEMLHMAEMEHPEFMRDVHWT